MRKAGVLLQIVLLLCVVFFTGRSALAHSLPNINVEAKTEEERDLLSLAIRDAYFLLEKTQQNLIDQGLFFVVFYEEPFTSEFRAFGPEDDIYYPHPYRYPDTTLYPKGTIKVNITLRTMDFIRITNKVKDPVVQTVLKHVTLDLLAHEIKHAEQYMQKPVLALSVPADCPGGICDEKKTEDTKTKVGYELEATAYGHAVGTKIIKHGDWDYASQWLKDHPELARGTRNNWSAKGFDHNYFETPITKWIKFLYGSMYEPVILAKKCAVGGLNADEAVAAKKFLSFNRKNDHFLERWYIYLTPVFEKLSSCVADNTSSLAPKAP
jgi:hypothetical protein